MRIDDHTSQNDQTRLLLSIETLQSRVPDMLRSERVMTEAYVTDLEC